MSTVHLSFVDNFAFTSISTKCFPMPPFVIFALPTIDD